MSPIPSSSSDPLHQRLHHVFRRHRL
ncbi:MAG TPA: DUF3678 domain-containing protein [Candidatus Poseidoniales archaeon]|nr:MAG TPA: DUF3678 domain-containing protein [Candidatus Poseidoniales archaeon]